jgi:hypothetical protein
MKTAAYGVFDDVRSVEHLFKLILSHGLGHDKQWRLRFVIAPTEQLRFNFEVVPKLDASWDPTSSRSHRPAISKPQTMSDKLVAATDEADFKARQPYGTMLSKRQTNLGGPALQLTRMDSRPPAIVRPPLRELVRPLGRMIVARFIPKACASAR